MNTLSMIAVIVFFIAVLGVVGYALFAMSPFAKHVDHFRDASGKRIGTGPRLD